MNFVFLSVIGLLAAAGLPAGRCDYVNPVLPPNHPDPGVLYYNGSYYAVTTTGDDANAYPILISTNLVNWTQVGYVFPAGAAGRPQWAVSDFWAPEIHRISDKQFNVYFAARHRDGTLSVGVARGTGPTGPFTDIGQPLVHTPGTGQIDPTYFADADGRTFVIWKEDGNAFNPPHPTPIKIQQTTADGLGVVGNYTVAISNSLPWEGVLVEGPWIIHRGQYYYLFYSGNGYTSPNYAVGVARSTNITGPYVKLGGPILQSDARQGFQGPGHCSVVQRPSGNWSMVYHSWLYGQVGQNGRAMLTDTVQFNSQGWPTVGANGSPSYTPQPVPS